MGQPIEVRTVANAAAGTRQYVLNRSLTGMGLKEYTSPDEATSDRPDDLAARQLFELEGVATVFIYGNVLTVGLADGTDPSSIDAKAVDLLQNLFVSYDINRV